VIICRTMMNPH